MKRRETSLAIGLGTIILSVTAYAAFTSVTLGTGTMSYSQLFDGPASTLVREATVDAGDVLGWHYHPGVVYSVVTEGELTVEDGCGGETTYGPGDAFEKADHRVHRGKNLGSGAVVFYDTFVTPLGDPHSVDTPQLCGPPVRIDECKAGGWETFTSPRSFSNQGDCEQYVNTGN